MKTTPETCTSDNDVATASVTASNTECVLAPAGVCEIQIAEEPAILPPYSAFVGYSMIWRRQLFQINDDDDDDDDVLM